MAPQGPPDPAAVLVHGDDRRPRPRRAAAAPRDRAQHQRRPHLGQHRRHVAPARGVRQDRLRHLLRGLPRDQPGHARARRSQGPRAPAARACATSGPLLIVWAASLAVLIFERDLGTSLLFFGLFVAMLYLATERFSWVVDRSEHVRRGRGRRGLGVPARPGPRRRLAPPARPGDLRPRPGRLGPARAAACSVWPTAGSSARAGARATPDLVPYVVLRLHLRLARRGARPHRPARAPA